MKSIKAWFWRLVGFFRRREDVPPLTETPALTVPEVPEVPAAEAASVRPTAATRRRKSRARTLGGLLDSLDTTFASLTRTASPGSFTNAELRTGLRNLGPYVPLNGRELLAGVRLEITDATKFSTLMFVARNMGEHNNEEWLYPDFVYASRLKKLPWDVQPLPGISYECGLAVRASAKKLWWVGFYVTIDPITGAVSACHQLLQDRVTIKNGEYTRKRWGVSPYAAAEWGKNDDERNEALANIFANLFRFWHEKDSMWSVSVRKGGKRVTFCVPQDETKTYFSDRDKTALTSAGKRRPIMHFVNEHQRVVDDGKLATVRSHIRGLRRFDWKGYECAITAPQFHRFNSLSFDLAPRLMEDMDEEDRAQKLITADRLGRIIADAEDSQRPMSIH
jgi:hypothetical protein